MSDMNVTSSAGTIASAYSSSAIRKDYVAETTVKETAAKETADIKADTAAVYEASAKDTTAKTGKTYSNPQLVQQLKADSEARIQQLQDIVNKLLSKQGNTYNTAQGLKSIYENLQVDDATRRQAQEDISENGYWGVKQTSERILDFAKALAGSDPSQLEKMRSAFEKGYKQAEKAWGDKLPQICQDTYDAVMKGFDALKSDSRTEE